VASVWIRARPTKSGASRFRVEYRLGGRESVELYGGTFKTRREASIRKAWIRDELAARRAPDLNALVAEPSAPTLAEAGERWNTSRVDVEDTTATQQYVSLKHALRAFGTRRVDEIRVEDVIDLVASLHAGGKKRGTIKRAVDSLAMVLDFASVEPNVARDKRVKLPREEAEEINPPTAEHVAAVYRLLPTKHRLALLFLDWSGARVSAIDRTLVRDYDEPRRRVRLRAQTTKTKKALWIELHPDLADAIEARIGPREDRDPDARLFDGSGADSLRTSIAKACRAAGVPHFSPHDLRHRRISLLHLRGTPWARIGEFVGQRNLSVTADTYTHVLPDETEVAYAELLAA
jgi:integrase